MLNLNRITHLYPVTSNSTESNTSRILTNTIILTLVLTLTACKSYRIEKIIPEETATSATLSEMANLSTLPIFKDNKYIRFSSHQREDGAEPPGGFVEKYLPDYWVLGWPLNYDSNHFLCRSANAEIAQFIVAPYRFDERICDEDYVKGAMMARFEGSGTLTRFWMTQLSAPSGLNANEILRIYKDDDPTPILQVMLKEVYNGSADEIFAKPFGSEKKDFINWNYPIDFNSKLIITIDRLGIPFDLYYYQVDAVLENSPIEKQVSDTALPERKNAQQFLNTFDALSQSEGDTQRITHSFAENTTSTLQVEGPGTFETVQINFLPEDYEALSSATIKINWDGTSTAAVDMPLLDLFNARQAVPPSQEYLLGSPEPTEGMQPLRLTLPMPFTTMAEFEIDLPDSVSAPVELELLLREGELPGNTWGYFNAQLNHTENPDSDEEYHPLIYQQGQGRLVGVCVQMEGKSGGEGFGSTLPFSFLEGDEIATIDGELTIHGTGTEDYFNSSFYFQNNEEDATPFAQVWGLTHDEANNQERVSACRWHLFSDTIDFQQEIDFKIELGPLTPDAVRHYRSTAYFYQ